MANTRHPRLFDKERLKKALLKDSRDEVARKWDVPYNSINHQVRKKFSEEEKALIVRKRFTFTDKEKLEFLREAEKTSISDVARRFNISRTQLQHWKKDLFDKELYLNAPKPRASKEQPLKKRRA